MTIAATLNGRGVTSNIKDVERQEVQTGKFGKDFVHFRHGFQDTNLFSDEALADLINNYPREYYMLTTMTEAGDTVEWHNGDFNGMPGGYVLDAIRNGRLWLCLRRLDLVAPEYAALVDDAFDEAEARDGVEKSSRRVSSLLISSPGAQVLYHSDIPMVALWHVRGRKRVWLYDADNKTHLPDEVLEGIVLRETEEEIPYDSKWDQDAKIVDLEPGFAISWPQNAPHRVENLDGLNVSVTTDYFTAASQRKYGVYFANGLMRRKLGWSPKSTRTMGMGATFKCAAALAMKKLKIEKSNERQMMQSFSLDPESPGAIRLLEKQDWQPIVQT